MLNFDLFRIDEPETDPPLGLITFVCLIVLFASLIGTFNFSVKYRAFHDLEVNGEPTQAVVVKRTRIAEDRRSPRFFVRYEFENVYAEQKCPGEFKSSITPKDQACRRSVQKQEISEQDYHNLTIGDTLRIRYLRSSNKTRSMIENGYHSKNTYLAYSMFLFLVALISGRLFFRAMRALAVTPRQAIDEDE